MNVQNFLNELSTLFRIPNGVFEHPHKTFQSPQWSNSKSLTENLYVPKEAFLCPQGSISKFPMERFKVPDGALQDSHM